MKDGDSRGDKVGKALEELTPFKGKTTQKL